MRLSEQTVSLLKNFASINQNIQFKQEIVQDILRKKVNAVYLTKNIHK